MNRILKAVLVDLSGTIHIENEIIEGAREAVQRLYNSNLKVRFLTNTSKESRKCLHDRLKTLGFCIPQDDIFTSLVAARSFIIQENLRPHLLLEPEALDDFVNIPTENPNAVLIGLAPSLFNYENINQVFRLVMDGAKIIGVNKSRYMKTKTGLSIGAGAFIAALEFSTGSDACIIGKPAASFFNSCLSELQCAPEEVVMIGDDIKDDILSAQHCGIMGMLVKTGKYRTGDDTQYGKPDYIFDSFPAAVDFLLDICSRQ